MGYQTRGAAWIVKIAAAGALSTAATFAAENITPPSTPEQFVQQALLSETDGGGQRAALLEPALQLDPDYAPAQWHSGNVRYKDKWTAATQVPDLAKDDARLNDYFKVRDDYPDTPAGQFELANWCGKRQLLAAERAHLLRVVELNPDHIAAHMRLGDHRFDGDWLTDEQWRDQQARAAQLREWWPKMKELRQGLAQPNPAQRAAAEARLKAISDPAAVPALVALAEESDEAGGLVVEVLGKIDGPQAAVALARLATFSSDVAVQGDAVEQLKQRPLEHFVPPMLSALSSTIVGRGELIRSKRGRIYRQTFVREGPEAKEELVRDAPVRLRREALAVANTRNLAPGINISTEALIPAAAEATAELERQNVAISDTNDRIIYVLAALTGRPMTSDPQDWWTWWHGHSELYPQGEKPTNSTYERANTVEGVIQSIGPSRSCFAAGTKVWTLLGPTAIETVKIGDQVLSQDPGTGELTFKPVLLTTVRDPSPMFVLEVGSEKIQATGGHLFWVTGLGWVKARDLKPGDALHVPTGTVPLTSLTAGATETAYNLVVDDFHSYFVGDGKLLCHDNTLREPTKAIVPGLVKR